MKPLSIPAALALALAMGFVPAATSYAQDEDVLVWGDTLPASLDPHVVFDVPMQFILLNVYDGLYRYQGNPPELVPWLAESSEVSEDGLTWTFKLRPGLTFHDGSALTADDVVYSFQRLLAIGKGPAGAFRPVLQGENVTALDDLTVRFVLDKPYAPFLSALPIVAIVNQEALEANAQGEDLGQTWLASNAAGSGAYAIDPASYRPQEALDLRLNPDHFPGWDHNDDPVELIRARPVLETSTRVLALLRGDIDATDSYLPTDQVERVERADGVRVARDESMRIFLIRMNNQKPPFDNLHARRCLSYAFNYDGFIGQILKNYAERNGGPLPRNLWGFPEDVQPVSYDLEKAKAECDLAREQGAPLDRPLEIHIQSALDQTTQAAQLFQSDLRRLDIELKLVPNTWPNLTSSTASPETTPDMWIHWVSTYFVDPENWIGQMYDSQFHGTWKASAWYQNDTVDQLLRQARAESDRDARAELYRRAARQVVSDAADIWIYNTVQLRGLSERVQGYSFSPVGSGGELRYVSVE
ncbi:MAG: ABC transporter substrate-binding protein [Candidatus Competibacterales bacterium]